MVLRMGGRNMDERSAGMHGWLLSSNMSRVGDMGSTQSAPVLKSFVNFLSHNMDSAARACTSDFGKVQHVGLDQDVISVACSRIDFDRGGPAKFSIERRSHDVHFLFS